MLDDVMQYSVPILCALLAGGLIGLEREWRGQAAGFRTHILVCLASALLVRAGVSMGDWSFELPAAADMLTDPSRMAQGVLTGIGLLCAGAIFREGFSIHGLTTAASLWITSALGILFGAGLYALGVAGAAVTVAILILLRLVDEAMPPRSVIDVSVDWRRDGRSPEEDVETALKASRGRIAHTGYDLLADGAIVRRAFKLSIMGEHRLRDLAQSLSAIPEVIGFRLDPRED